MSKVLTKHYLELKWLTPEDEILRAILVDANPPVKRSPKRYGYTGEALYLPCGVIRGEAVTEDDYVVYQLPGYEKWSFNSTVGLKDICCSRVPSSDVVRLATAVTHQMVSPVVNNVELTLVSPSSLADAMPSLIKAIGIPIIHDSYEEAKHLEWLKSGLPFAVSCPSWYAEAENPHRRSPIVFMSGRRKISSAAEVRVISRGTNVHYVPSILPYFLRLAAPCRGRSYYWVGRVIHLALRSKFGSDFKLLTRR
jgi:hypothetical protein